MDTVGTGRFVEPKTVIDHFHLRAGDKIADFGAGAGYFVKGLSEAVGNEGRVYACDIQKSLVDTLGTLIRDERLSNVSPIWCDLEKTGGTKLADGVLDVGLLVNTLFQFEQKELALTEIARAIRTGGKFFVIDWTESFAGLGPRPNDIVSEEAAKTLVSSAGFEYERSFPSGAHHYGLAFRRI